MQTSVNECILPIAHQGDESTMKEITSSTSDFEDLIKGNYLYVDKTEFIWNLVKSYKGVYFMARPRRFGKSLTVSTLETIFEGKKELFKGLAIYNKDYDWPTYPVIHLDFANFKSSKPEKIEAFLNDKLTMVAEKFKLELKGASSATRFENLINDIFAKHGKVVILVDEYDKPILESLGEPHLKDVLETLKAFYTCIKSADKNERFVFITGVSKFSHVSLFSGMNNPTDLTMRSEYATMFGYTEKEFESYFAEYIDVAFQKLNMSRDEFLQAMKKMYDGYRFSKNAETVYNPVSVARFFDSQEPEFLNFWFETGTPTFVLDYCKKTKFDFEKLLTEAVPQLSLSAYEIDNINPLPLLLQTGYLTIKDSFTRNRRTYYHMHFPNDEVAWAFEVYLLNAYTGTPTQDISALASDLADNIATGNADGIKELIKNFFAKIPYNIQLEDEKYYQSLFYAIFVLLNVDIAAEACTNKGRIDATAAAGDWRFIFEFKLNKTAEKALDQIEEKEYYQKYSRDGKRIMIVGANFDFKKRQLTDWIAKEVTP